ncbi:purine-nucleoside phosphorylase [Streptobacillus moniliformis]|uniref:Purine nucleoside phosphorylase n=1 Tax=Streptobacillus moniliformis (strain ATCC 14647 / DSM 12112 / NCTC 10651 / 9901) TaxID=519441 RepID=D1AY54_STRM9|nr:purine-nucleoside phosphorylase [Streptobacillus moniliformis]ACZ01230.1 inosine guanosine and xanthosine phosphorylase family [Streptobacillus moniliformis DSM 12112]AVL42411.1 purine-nucleoside phosphorylase [Streptobacillus moniliformis]QXW65976.1 purine-nucleoside phosphorylase [Streptobacillus moniliformis]SQA13615.1 Purine nucleoside phosphorylase 1 [Streptobacillus moniliformis]
MFYNKVKESADYISSMVDTKVDIAVILGSGLGKLVDIMEDKKYISYKDIPNFPQISVVGHAGNLVFGKIGNTRVMALQGRFHYYEGYTMKETAYPVYVMKLLGIDKMIVTNACGGINPEFKPGDLMIIEDFINGVGNNPLRGSNDERFGQRFPDMSEPYSLELRERAKKVADRLGIETKKGVYTFFQGPYYESASEIRMYGRLGSDAIGMSTVPETIVANYVGIKTLGISCITNMATGLREGNHSHEEVVEIAEEASKKLCMWMEEFIKELV